MKDKVLEAVKRMPDNRCIMIPDGGRGSWFKSDIVEAIEKETEMGKFFVQIFSRAINLREGYRKRRKPKVEEIKRPFPKAKYRCDNCDGSLKGVITCKCPIPPAPAKLGGVSVVSAKVVTADDWIDLAFGDGEKEHSHNPNEISLCNGCNCMTKTLRTRRTKPHCGKCGNEKEGDNKK